MFESNAPGLEQPSALPGVAPVAEAGSLEAAEPDPADRPEATPGPQPEEAQPPAGADLGAEAPPPPTAEQSQQTPEQAFLHDPYELAKAYLIDVPSEIDNDLDVNSAIWTITKWGSSIEKRPREFLYALCHPTGGPVRPTSAIAKAYTRAHEAQLTGVETIEEDNPRSNWLPREWRNPETARKLLSATASVEVANLIMNQFVEDAPAFKERIARLEGFLADLQAKVEQPAAEAAPQSTPIEVTHVPSSSEVS